MEWMNSFSHSAVQLWLAQSTVVFFLVSGVVLLAIGVGLIVNSAGALRLFGSMNRWVSFRRATRPLEIPRDTRQAVQKYRYPLAAFCVASGAFAIYGLLMHYDVRAIVRVMGLQSMHPAFVGWLLDSARWMLIVGNAVAVAVGVMLAFFPGALVALEARGSTWFSERKMLKDADAMRFRLDGWVSANPRLAGGIIAVFALGLLGAFGMLMPLVW